MNMFKKQWNPLMSLTFVIVLGVISFYVLHIGASLIIPFIIALLFSFAIIGLSDFYQKLKLPSFLSFTLSLWTFIFIFWLFWKMIGSNVEEFQNQLPVYQDKVYSIVLEWFNYFKLQPPTSVEEVLTGLNLQDIFGVILTGVTQIFSSAGIILFYVLFILLEHRHFRAKLSLMFTDEHRKEQIAATIDKIKKDVKSYFVIKTLVSLVTAGLSYCVMILVGLDFAVFWACLIFVLNFIPSIGSIIAVAFPILLSMIQFEGYYVFLFTATGLIWVQTLMWNIIEPRFMGNKLNLSPLVIILALGFWWALWWVVGMLLSVPIMVIINIILSKFPETRSIAILLSEKGELQVENVEEVQENRQKLIKTVRAKFSKNEKKHKKSKK